MGSADDSPVDRRRALQVLGVGGAVGLAGCLGSLSGDEEEEEVEVSAGEEQTRDEIADHLELMAEKLRTQDAIAIEVGDETIEIRPPESPTYDIEIEDQRVDGTIQREVEFQLGYERTDEEEPLTEDGF